MNILIKRLLNNSVNLKKDSPRYRVDENRAGIPTFRVVRVFRGSTPLKFQISNLKSEIADRVPFRAAPGAT